MDNRKGLTIGNKRINCHYCTKSLTKHQRYLTYHYPLALNGWKSIFNGCFEKYYVKKSWFGWWYSFIYWVFTKKYIVCKECKFRDFGLFKGKHGYYPIESYFSGRDIDIVNSERYSWLKDNLSNITLEVLLTLHKDNLDSWIDTHMRDTDNAN